MTENIPKEITEAYKEYIFKYEVYKKKFISWLKETKGTIFKLKDEQPYHTCNSFEGAASTTFFGGYCKIEDDESGRLVVRLMHMDGVSSWNHFYHDENWFRYSVSVRNFTGYSYESLMNIIDRPATEEELIPFVTDIMSERYEIDGYFLNAEDIKNNRKPWEHRSK